MKRNRFFAAFAASATLLAGLAAGAPAANPAESTETPGVAEPNASTPSSPSSGGSSPDAFYVSPQAIGEQALAAGRAAEAAENLRIASFGLLDQPEKLSGCLVSLAVAQQRAGRTAEAEATLRRFQAVQELFPSWGRLALAPELRSEFVALARKRLPGLNLESPREAERRPAPVSPAAPSAETRPPSPPIAAAPPTVAPPALPGPAALPVALEAPPAPKPVPAPTERPEKPAAGGLERTSAPVRPAPATSARAFPAGFFDREVRTGPGVIFEIRPDQARLFVDGRYVGVSGDWGDGTGRPFPLAAGEHDVRAVLPGYRELRLRLVAESSRTADAVASADLVRLERRSFRRIPRPDYVTAGRVAFAPELRGAEVAVDGEPTGAADRFTVSAPMRLSGPAVHDVVLSKPGRPARTIRVLASPTAGTDLVVVRAVL